MRCVVGNTEFHYETIGEGKPIVLLHGWRSDHRIMVDIAEPVLAKRDGWQRIYPDLPGMGETSGAGITNQDQVLDLVAGFIETVTGGRRCVVGGFSYGGYLALGAAYKYSDRLDGLLLLAPDGLPGGGVPPRLPPPATLVEDPGLFEGLDEGTAQHFRKLAVVQTREVRDLVVNLARPAHLMADEEYLSRLEQQWSYSFEEECLRALFAEPTLVVTGRQDAVTGYADAYDLMENFPRGTYAVLDGAGHALAWERRAVFNALFGDWIDRVERNTRRRGERSIDLPWATHRS